jgi:hypothetical protein
LGKWYDGPGKEVFGDAPSFRKLLEPHSKVHASVHHMLTLMTPKWEQDEAKQNKVLESLQKAEAASLEVMSIIDQIVLEKHPESH